MFGNKEEKLRKKLALIEEKKKEKEMLEAIKFPEPEIRPSKIEKIKTVKQDTERVEYDPIKKENYLTKLKDRYFPQRSFLINMELRNGLHDLFIIQTKENTFVYEGGEYIIDTTMKHYVTSAKLYCLYYHQDISIPIKFEIDVKGIKKAFSNDQLENAINPYTVHEFMESKVAQAVMQAASIDEFFKNMKFIIIINLAVTVIILLLIVKSTGVLKNIHIPGL